MVLPGVAKAAESADCYTTFYQTKDMKCIDSVVETVQKTPPSQQPNTEPQAVIGFFAQIFGTYPQEKERILHQKATDHAKSIYLAALYRADLMDEAEKYAQANGWAEGFKKYHDNNVPTLTNVTPFAYPGDNDLLIGAYMASGNTGYIKKILNNFTAADDEMASIALRMALMNSKFGSSLAAPGREKTMALAICEKYQCKTNIQNFLHVATLASAFWALQSLSQKDEGIKKTFVDFFEKDTRLKRLVAIEENGFSNYLTTLAAYAVTKNNPNINASLSIYEKLGSAQDALDAMKKKN